MSARIFGNGHDGSGEEREVSRFRHVEVTLTDEQFAAVEGWRAANRVRDRSDAVRELVRIGLLSEIARVYRMVASVRDDGDLAEGLSETRG